ncbi:MAG: deoxynucleoside kinase [Planctomycetes bacterium]|nr:deoxynucleoside kinase [Planctomycetota bacterium]
MAKKKALCVAIEGVIGVGKTTLAHAVAEHLGAVRLFESDIKNPFLGKFYKQKKRYALHCQLWFLQGRIQQFNQSIAKGVPIVCDHSLIKELIFAELNLQDQELELYKRMYDIGIQSCTLRPDVIIYLTADIKELGRRIKDRNLAMESGIEWSYLKRLVEAYDLAFSSLDKQRVVVVNADSINIAEDPEAMKRLMKACLAAGPGLSYCNPVS